MSLPVTFILTSGEHATPEEGMGLMEAVAFLAREKHSDRPECACPVITVYGWNLDLWMGGGEQGDALRAQYLAPLVSKLVGTRSTSEVSLKRAFFFVDRAVRLFAPMALESAGLTDEAERLRRLDEIVDKKTAAFAAARADAARAAATTAFADAARAATAWLDDDDADFAAAFGDASRAAAFGDAASTLYSAHYAAHFAAEAADAADRLVADAAESAVEAVAGVGAWEQAAKVLAEACEITEGGE